MKSNRPYKLILDFLNEFIEQHDNEANCKLPSERMLAIKFNASRRSVRLAYEHLIAKEEVVNMHGKGYFTTGRKKTLTDAQTSQYKEISLVIPALKSSLTHEILVGISDFCYEHEMVVSLKFTHGKASLENQYIEASFQSDAKGLILFPIDNELFNENLLKLSANRYPLTIIDRYFKNINASFVATNNVEAMLDAIKFIHSKKIKNVLYISAPTSRATSVEERLHGFKQGITKHYGTNPYDSILVIKYFSPNEIQLSLKEYLSSHPTPQLIITHGVIHIIEPILSVLDSMNLSVPGDIKFMLFDNDLSFYETQKLSPYVIKQPAYLIGYEAAKMLYNQIYGDLRVENKLLPVEIIDYSKKSEIRKFESHKSTIHLKNLDKNTK